MNQNSEIANVTSNAGYRADSALYNSLNELLPADYALEEAAATSNITLQQGTDSGDTSHHYVFQSNKEDAWGNKYFVILSDEDRNNSSAHSDFYVEVVSAGPNAKSDIAGVIEADDIFLVAQFTDGNVVSKIYNNAKESSANVSGAPASKYIGSALIIAKFTVL